MYIEFVIADNFLLTFLAGAAGFRLCRKRVMIGRVSIAAAVGTAVAVCYPFIPAAWIETIVKIVLFLSLSLIMYRKTKRFILSAMLFLASTFALGGASYAVLLCLGGGAASVAARYPICIVLGVGLIVWRCGRFMSDRLSIVRARAPYEYAAEVTVWGSKMTFSAFLDTGNLVIDGKSGLPVLITDLAAFTDKLSDDAAIRFGKELPRLRKMSADTPAGSADIYLLRPSEIAVYSDRHKHKINAMIGLIGGGRLGCSHEMLLCPAAMEAI